MNDRIFRDAMGKFSTGVTVLTTVSDEGVHGMTANAFMSVSLDPKLVLISVADKANMDKKIKQSGMFAVSILGDDQLDVSMHFAGQKNNTDAIDFEWFDHLPVVKNSLASIVCDVYSQQQAGDHTLYIGEVKDLATQDSSPLTFFKGKYGQNQLINFASV